jgi:hypothetical protein
MAANLHNEDEASAKKEEEDWEAAEKLYLESLTILRRHLDKNDENIAEIYRELAACALNKMELDKAETYSREYLHSQPTPRASS